MMPPIHAQSLTVLIDELQRNECPFRFARIFTQLIYQIVVERRLSELSYYLINRMTPETLKRSICLCRPPYTSIVDHAIRWGVGPWAEDFDGNLLFQKHSVYRDHYFFPTSSGFVLAFGSSGIVKLSCTSGQVHKASLLASPFPTRHNSVCELPNGVVVAGEYGRFAKRIVFIFPDETVVCCSPYADVSGVRHIHLLVYWHGRVFITTGDGQKRLDYWPLEPFLVRTTRQITLKNLVARLGGFISCARHKNNLYFGSDFFGQDNYILKLSSEGYKRRLFLPKAIRSLVIDRIEVIARDKLYFALGCLSTPPKKASAVIIFDPSNDVFLTDPLVMEGRLDMPMTSLHEQPMSTLILRNESKLLSFDFN